jgi:hypothetical protein
VRDCGGRSSGTRPVRPGLSMTVADCGFRREQGVHRLRKNSFMAKNLKAL